MEGIWQNYIVFDATYKMGYKINPINLTILSNQIFAVILEGPVLSDI